MIEGQRKSSRAPLLLACALGAGMLAGCATAPVASAPTPTATAAADTVPLVTTPPAATVIDRGDEPVLCNGAVLESLPPQCSGLSLIGWDWKDLAGAYEEASGVRWGDFTITGTYDAAQSSLTVVTAKPAPTPARDEGAAGAEMFATPCAEPPGGWRVLDTSSTTDASMDRAFELAATLPGYVTSWVDRSRTPKAPPGATPEEQLMETWSHPDLTIINVRFVGDRAAAEQSLRKVWGGMLCVSEGHRTAVELQGIVDTLVGRMSGAEHIFSVGTDSMAEQVQVTVAYDDGMLQDEMDDEFGPGLVLVSSYLTPAR